MYMIIISGLKSHSLDARGGIRKRHCPHTVHARRATCKIEVRKLNHHMQLELFRFPVYNDKTQR